MIQFIPTFVWEIQLENKFFFFFFFFFFVFFLNLHLSDNNGLFPKQMTITKKILCGVQFKFDFVNI